MSMTAKPSTPEEEFFALEEAEKKRKLHAERAASQSVQEKEAAKKLHWMKCPKCGSELTEVAYRDVQIERCFSCGSVVLDSGELEALAGRDDSYVKGVLRFFAK